MAKRKSIKSFDRTHRNLPHWQEPGSVYFITWNTIDNRNLTPEEKTITLGAIQFWNNTRWTVFTSVVMPDHVHVLVQPLRMIDEEQAPKPSPVTQPIAAGDVRGFWPLSVLLHSVKSYSAHEIAKTRGRKGSVWLDERYDRIMRDDEEFWLRWQYIRDNPVKAELARAPEEYEWFYQQSGLEGPDQGATG
ncbi:MAG: hypothetical protein IID44_03610 [Planctomycetes bacterium]|nr:hypothetical protein [Planctomycetota bacterium]